MPRRRGWAGSSSSRSKRCSVEGDGGVDVFEVGFREAPIAGAAAAGDRYGLADRVLDAGSQTGAAYWMSSPTARTRSALPGAGEGAVAVIVRGPIHSEIEILGVGGFQD
jgi:hypothetical protein